MVNPPPPAPGAAGSRVELVHGAVARVCGPQDAPSLWAVHGLGESGSCFHQLMVTDLVDRFRLIAVDLPGFGASPAREGLSSVAGFAQWLAEAIASGPGGEPLGLIGHSVGSVIAARAAAQLVSRPLAMVSIEGNLTEADAYFSGQAMHFAAAASFREHLLLQIRRMAESGTGPSSARSLWRYHACLTLADAETLFRLGRDVKAGGPAETYGGEYRAVDFPRLYYFSTSTTTATTQTYIARHGIAAMNYPGGHWPMVDAPAATAAALGRFFTAHLARR